MVVALIIASIIFIVSTGWIILFNYVEKKEVFLLCLAIFTVFSWIQEHTLKIDIWTMVGNIGSFSYYILVTSLMLCFIKKNLKERELISLRYKYIFISYLIIMLDSIIKYILYLKVFLIFVAIIFLYKIHLKIGKNKINTLISKVIIFIGYFSFINNSINFFRI